MKTSENIQHFKFFGDNPPGTGNASSVEHITPDGGRSVLCDKLGLDPETTSWEQAMKLCKERNDLQDDAENEAHIWVHKVELV